jgi:hypothetical protein
MDTIDEFEIQVLNFRKIIIVHSLSCIDGISLICLDDVGLSSHGRKMPRSRVTILPEKS